MKHEEDGLPIAAFGFRLVLSQRYLCFLYGMKAASPFPSTKTDCISRRPTGFSKARAR